MSDIYNFADDIDIVSPYGRGPFRQPGVLYAIVKKHAVPMYFAGFLKRIPHTGQRWTPVRAIAKRFDDLRLVTEYIRFFETLPDRLPGDSVALNLLEGNPAPRIAERVVLTDDSGMSIGTWLTTYSGVRRK